MRVACNTWLLRISIISDCKCVNLLERRHGFQCTFCICFQPLIACLVGGNQREGTGGSEFCVIKSSVCLVGVGILEGLSIGVNSHYFINLLTNFRVDGRGDWEGCLPEMILFVRHNLCCLL